MNDKKFRVRGCIEGYYGRPWTEAQRLDMLRYMAALGENTFYYAPKDDPYHRRLWRDYYPEKKLTALKKAVDTAAECGIDFHYCIAPGLSMCYSSERDFGDLCRKTLSLYAIGIRRFGLLLDDIPEKLFHEEDREVFPDIAAAHVSLCKKYYAFLKGISRGCTLTVCPLQYHGTGEEDLIRRFASQIPSDVFVFFTGPDICSAKLTSADAQVFEKATGHKPLYWDNYPVNDAEMFKEMHIGPLIGRDPDLYQHCEGIISNCSEYFECGKFPIYTVAEYLSDPEHYDPEQAFSNAVKTLIPDKTVSEAFVLFADHLRTSCLHDENSRVMGEVLGEASLLRETGDLAGAIARIEEYTLRVADSVRVLQAQTSPLFRELSEWLNKYYLMSAILDRALEVLKGAGDRKKLAEQMNEYNNCATVLTAFCFREYIESVLAF